MRLTDLFLALPVLPLLLLIVMPFREALANCFGPEMGIFILIVSTIGVMSWMYTARIVRGEVLAIKQRELVLASRSIGTPPRRTILRHVLPNVADHRLGDSRHRHSRHYRKCAVVSWPWLSAGLPDLGTTAL